MLKKPKFAAVEVSHSGQRHADSHAAMTAFEWVAPIELHYKIRHELLKVGFCCLKSTGLTPFDRFATAVSAVPDLMIHYPDMIPEVTAERCLSWPIFTHLFAQLAETKFRSLSATTLRAT